MPEEQMLTTVASGGWGASPPRPPCAVYLYPNPLRLHQGIDCRPPSVASGGRSSSCRICTRKEQPGTPGKKQMFTTVASGGWGAPPPRPPCGMCLYCIQVLARPGLRKSAPKSIFWTNLRHPRLDPITDP